jgi:hypothetical protein
VIENERQIHLRRMPNPLRSVNFFFQRKEACRIGFFGALARIRADHPGKNTRLATESWNKPYNHLEITMIFYIAKIA